MAPKSKRPPGEVHKTNPAGAEKLKEQGNALFAQRKWAAAYVKYSEAIGQDPTNPVYWSNRSACSLEMKDYIEACSDAKAATEIDPTYAKAWGRLGAAERAISNFEASATAYKKALEMLPPDEKMTPVDKRLLEQFTTALEIVEDDAKTRHGSRDRTVVVEGNGEELDANCPWRIAMNMAGELERSGNKDSSAWLILSAYKDWSKGIEIMKKLKSAHVDGRRLIKGETGALASLVGGIIKDQRVFHVEENFIQYFTDQVNYETSIRQAWDCSLNIIKREVVERAKATSWEEVAYSLLTTIRIWILRGFIENSTGKHASGAEFYGKALELIDWGRETIAKATSTELDETVVFGPAVVRAIRALQLSSIMDALAHDITEKYTFEDLIKMAETLVTDVDAHPPPPQQDPALYLAFWVNPKGEALSIMGFCYMRIGHLSHDKPSKQRNFALASRYYSQAGDTYPDDDEKRVYFNTFALEALWNRDAPLKETLPLVERTKPCVEKMKRIWANSAMARRRDANISLMLEFEKQVRKVLKNGKMNMNSVAKPHMRR